MNDPNGFVYAFGRYHLFGQSNPLSLEFGLMRWAHYSSADLLHWEYVGDAIVPEADFEKPFGCFSGSSYFDGRRLHLYYTAASEGKQQQCYAYSDDGETFVKYEGNPILGAADLPDGYLIGDFRDPKVLVKKGKPYLLLACRRQEGGSSILLFEGENYRKFHFKSTIFTINNERGGMIECPDFFFAEGNEGALVFSIQFPDGAGRHYYQNTHSTCYVRGTLDLESGRFAQEGEIREIDQGFDFYALQTSFDGKRVLGVAWEGMWDRNYPSRVDGYAGNFTAVRELRLQNGELVSAFPEELESATAETAADCGLIHRSGSSVLEGFGGDYCRLRFRVKPRESSYIDLLSDGEGSALRIEFRPSYNDIVISRLNMRETVFNNDHFPSETHYVHIDEGLSDVKFDILLDGIAIDILINGGRHSFSTLFFPKSGGTDIRLGGEMEIPSIKKYSFKEDEQ